MDDIKSRKIKLTNKEIEILNLTLLGYTNSEIEEKLFITKHTVKKHLNNIYSKFYLDNLSNANKRIKLISIFLALFFREYCSKEILIKYLK